MTEDQQNTPGRTSHCCAGMLMALNCGYVRKGFLWYKYDPPRWFPWNLNITGKGYRDVSPIQFCPFCGTDLDSPE